MLSVINQIGTLGVIIIIGVIVSKLGMMTQEVRKKMSAMLINVTAPLFAIKAFQLEYSPLLVKNMILVAISAFLIISIGLLVGKIAWKNADENKKDVLKYANGFMNSAFLGYPLIGGLYGDEGIIYVAIFVMAFLILLWTAGIHTFTKEKEKWYTPFTRPGLIGVVVGLVLFLMRIELPYFLFNSFSMVGSMTSPLAMLLIGAFLSEVSLKDIVKDKNIYLLSVYRLLISPAIMLLLLQLFKIDHTVAYATLILVAGMPAATNTVLFATMYEGNATYASGVVSMTTLISIVTLPLWVWIISIV